MRRSPERSGRCAAASAQAMSRFGNGHKPFHDAAILRQSRAYLLAIYLRTGVFMHYHLAVSRYARGEIDLKRPTLVD